jgi:hypothetical protein
MFCVFAGFGIAVHVFSDNNKKHFVEFQHRKMDLVVFLLAVLQLVGVIVRPGLPKPNPSDATTSVPDNIDTVGKEETLPMPPTKKSLFRSIWEYTHRVLGIGGLALAWWTCYPLFTIVQSGVWRGRVHGSLLGCHWWTS